MADITTVWLDNHGDWQLSGALLESGDDLVTACLISLFTDAQASPDDVIPDAPPNSPADPRGWWGDAYSPEAVPLPIGSKLWLLARAKQTAQVLVNAQDYITQALAWLISDGVAASIDVACQWMAPGFLGAAIEIFKTDGSTQSLNFNWAWSGQ